MGVDYSLIFADSQVLKGTDDKKMKDVTEQLLNRTMLFSFLRNLLYLISAASSPPLFPVTKRERVNMQTGNCLSG